MGFSYAQVETDVEFWDSEHLGATRPGPHLESSDLYSKPTPEVLPSTGQEACSLPS